MKEPVGLLPLFSSRRPGPHTARAGPRLKNGAARAAAAAAAAPAPIPVC